MGGAHFPLADAAERTARTISNSCDVGCVITITAIRTRHAVGVGVDLYLYCGLCRDDLGDADDQKGFVKHWRGSKDFVKTARGTENCRLKPVEPCRAQHFTG